MDPIRQQPAPGWYFIRALSLLIRLRTAILLVGAGIVAWSVYQHVSTPTPEAADASQSRMPVANPQLEPDRPDLIGEPRIDE